MIGHGKETIGIRRQIDANDLCLLVDNVVYEPRILMAEAVVVLSPDVARQQVVQRANGAAPGNVIAYLQPLGVLIEHGIDDVDECLVAGEEAVAAGEEVAFQPTLALMLTEHLHYAPVRRQMIIPWEDFSVPGSIGDLECILPAVGVVLVGTKEPEIPGVHV